MANPTPTINQINAFNATQGTTIDFNIIGGTELVRSNRIYIYDLSDNSLICTHLYVSTESIHELPANIDSSIVYESGKSSADFVNGAQYYAQIQTYTDTAGTEGGSGLSVAKMFWCLVDPTLTITTIPSTISTTSYNVSATYNANTSVVSNIIQQYQFSLYSATGSLLQSSGVVVGSGTQQGTSTIYDISYNFTGLSVGSSYYVVVDVTTTQGMSVSVQSSTFTVSIDTPTLGEATVVNNACDGYISVTSNLSSEYGGSGSGEIATFETDSVNDVSSLKVTLTPQQDGTPWIGTDHDTTPYLHRAMPTQSNDYNRESGVIVGGTVGWNQMISIYGSDRSKTENGVTFQDNRDGTYTVSTDSNGATGNAFLALSPVNITQGHKYFWSSTPKGGSLNTYYSYITNNVQGGSDVGNGSILLGSGSGNGYIVPVYVKSGTVITTPIVFKPICIDLTAMFNPTIADYVYSLEQATAGSGIAWLRSYGFLTEDYYPYSANTLQSVQATAHKTYGADGNVIGNYALDSSVTLQGLFQLDNGELKAYGDIYPPSGEIERKFGTLDLGSATWTYNSTYSCWVTSAIANTVKKYPTQAEMVNAIAENYVVDTVGILNGSNFTVGKFILGTSGNLFVKNGSDSATPTGAFVYELATPTTETADPYTNPQVVDPDGTEEYVTANYVPVGHDSTYSLVCPISGYDEVSANVVGKNLCDNADSLLDLGTGVTYSEENGYYFPRHYDTGASHPIFVNEDGLEGQMTLSFKQKQSTTGQVKGYLYFTYTDGTYGRPTIYPTTANAWFDYSVTSDASKTVANARYGYSSAGGDSWVKDIQIEEGSTATDYEPYQGQTYTADLPQTVYGGTVDLVSGVLTVDKLVITRNTANMNNNEEYPGWKDAVFNEYFGNGRNVLVNEPLDIGESYGVNTVVAIGAIWLPVGTYGKTQSEWIALATDVQITIPLATPQTYQLTPQQIQTLVGVNNVWSEQGNVELSYHIPITNLLVKRQDVDDVSGDWLTLYSQPITQASDMDFTFIDFLNQYGKTYKYALVPLLTQTQSGVEVEVEGGYTVSDEVQSVFDGVFIADSTGSQKCKANVGYGNVDMNQAVGTITPIGAKYPVVITNSQNQYHNGSISGTIVPDDYYFNGNLSRIDMVNKRNELEQFLTNKRAKIIKDWNGNTWLVMIMENINCTFNNEYGMGIVNFTANWIEVGDPTNQQDLQATGLIDVGGV